jgi:diaminopimelate epimerase
MSAPLPFRKYEGLGNDFIIVDAIASTDAATVGDLTPSRVAALCDRRFGVGGDGVLLLTAPRTAGSLAAMRVINADGSIPEMCGNGVRCVALDLARKSGLREGTVVVDTDAGVRSCRVEDGDAVRITVDMGVIRLLGERVIAIEGQPQVLALADAGNPHAILFGAYPSSEIQRLGPALATHSSFPRGTNVEFASVSDGAIDLVVWERGVGITLACGTGACATAAVACASGRTPFGVPIALRLPGGVLEVTIDRDYRAIMRGPAKHVFSGVSEV